MNKSSIIGIAILVLTALFCILSLYMIAKVRSPEREISFNTSTTVSSIADGFMEGAVLVSLPNHESPWESIYMSLWNDGELKL